MITNQIESIILKITFFSFDLFFIRLFSWVQKNLIYIDALVVPFTQHLWFIINDDDDHHHYYMERMWIGQKQKKKLITKLMMERNNNDKIIFYISSKLIATFCSFASNIWTEKKTTTTTTTLIVIRNIINTIYTHIHTGQIDRLADRQKRWR